MAEDREDAELGPTYKSLFLACCFIIGSAFGWWLTNFITSYDASHREVIDRLTKLESRALADEEANKYRDHKIDDHEERLRRIDRRP